MKTNIYLIYILLLLLLTLVKLEKYQNKYYNYPPNSCMKFHLKPDNFLPLCLWSAKVACVSSVDFVLRVAKSFGQMSQSPVSFVCFTWIPPPPPIQLPTPSHHQIGDFFCISGACAILTANCTQMASNLLMQADLFPLFFCGISLLPHAVAFNGGNLTRIKEFEIRIARREKELLALGFPCCHFASLPPRLWRQHNAHCRLGQIKQPVFVLHRN